MNRSRHDFGDGSQDKASETGEPIAIVGAACRLPGAPDLDAFARLLFGGVDAVTEIPDDRWNKAQLYHPDRGQRGKSYTFAAGVLDDVKSFDAAFFAMSPREAVQTDPQQRLSLELAYEALEDAGLDVGHLAGQAVGVFVGGSSWDYLTLHVADPSVTDAYSMTGATLCSLSNRISYAFDFRGPSLTIDTACSSSLVALHQACEALRAGHIPMALVGGVNLLLAPQSYVGFSAASMLSPRGRCHAFDASADGYVRAEGGGFIVLKPLGEALAAGDVIRAVIRGTGVNSDGRTTGFSLPNKQAQMALLEQVYERFGLDPARLIYLEAHGTGTPAGDPIEAGALGTVLGGGRQAPLPIGSVKTNIGHLEAASGMAGLMKAIVIAESGMIPASLHLRDPNPDIPFDALNLQLVRHAQPVASEQGLIGVNSFGFGGTNAHGVLERPPIAYDYDVEEDGAWPPLLLSAQTDGALRSLAAEWQRLATDKASDPGALVRLIRSAGVKRQQLTRRTAITADGVDDLLGALQAFQRRERNDLVHEDTAVHGKTAFVFSGNGSQWAGMARDALDYSPAFRSALAGIEAVLAPELGWSVVAALEAPDADRLRDTAVAQPLLFAIQTALVMALRHHGVEADAFMGHSVGEVAAAWAAGALDLPQASRVIAARSRAQQSLHGIGGMAVLGLGADASAAAIAAIDGTELAVAAHNSDGGTTVAGTSAQLDLLEAEAKRQGWRFTRLDLDYAFHSAIMDPIEPALMEALDGLRPRASGDRFVSTVTGAPLDGQALDARYWWRNVRQPVLFAEAARGLVARGVRIFVEIGPHPVVRAYLSEALRVADAEGRVVPTLQRRPAIRDPIRAIAARCHAAGCDIRDSGAFFGAMSARGLPRYPWQREAFWLGRTTEAADAFMLPYEHPLLGIRWGSEAEEWRQHIGISLQPWLADHVVGGTAVMPAAALLDMALAAARARFPTAAVLEILEVEISRALVLETGLTRETMLRVGPSGDFEIRSRPRLSDDGWTVHVKGRLAGFDGVAPTSRFEGGQPVTGHVGAASLYALAAGMGLAYGPAFRGVAGIDLFDDMSALATLAPQGLVGGGFLLSPDLLDGALQALLSLAAGKVGTGAGVMPWRFGRVRLLRRDGATPAAARLRLTRVGPRSVRADVRLLDGHGETVAELLDCWFVQVALSAQASPEDFFFHPVTVPAASDGGDVPPSIEEADILYDGLDTAPPEAALLADAFAAASAFEALRPFADEGGLIDGEALVRGGRVAASSVPLLYRLLGWLEQDGLASAEGTGCWRLDAADLPAADAILQTMLADQPAAIAEIALLASAKSELHHLLTEGVDAATPPAAALLDQLRYDSPSGAATIARLLDAIEAVAARWPDDRPLRILEIGARQGDFTRRLLRRLGTRARAVTAVTDADDLPLLASAMAGAPAAYAIAGDDLPSSADAPFDLIVGLDPGDRALASVLRERTAPGALLLLAGPMPSRLRAMIDPAGDQLANPRELSEAGFGPSIDRPIHAGLWPSHILLARAEAAAVAEPVEQGGPLTILSATDNPHAAALLSVLRRHDLIVTMQVPEAFGQRPLSGSTLVFLEDLGALPEQLAAVASLARWSPEEGTIAVTLVIHGAAEGAPVAAAIMGARRVLANEAPNIRCRLLRLEPGLSAEAGADRLASELLRSGEEQEVTLGASTRRVARVRPGLPGSARPEPKALRLAIARPGLLDSLGWSAETPAAPGSGELAIKVEAAGLNFRDVMWAMGLLPDEALLDGFAGPTLGLECAGVVTAVGPDVAGFAPGDRVMAFAPASLSTHTVTAAHAVMHMPSGMDFAAAATVPVAFLTVVYAMGHLARLGRGETVLVHGGAGGVGLAAIQFARHRGATVFATAGSPAKRALLESLGVDAIFDSRSLAFADDVMRLTGGEGVDVVLNSLAGEAMQRSLGLLKPFGRFLELGKRDFYENNSVGLRPFRNNITYFGIDADQLPLRRSALAAELFAEISGLMASGALRPLPHRVFDYADAEAAFRLMQSSGHIGKIVLAPGPVLPAALTTAATLDLRADGAYVITGGLAGFGLETARWLGRRGARKLALVGRRGLATPGAAEALADLTAAGIDARAYAADVTDEAALAEVLAQVRTEQGALCGVVHAAVAMDDALLGQLDADRFARALAPKLDGAEMLDRLTRRDPVEMFLLFSSVTTPMGNPGQGNYVAANAAIEAVAERRRAEGLPALAVQWGPIGDAGYLARSTGVSDLLSRQLGGAHLTAAQALDALPALLASGVAVAGFATVRWSALRKSLPLLSSPLFAEMETGGSSETTDVDLRELLASCAPEEARKRAIAMLVEEVARIMKLAQDRIEPQRPLTELGMDSLMAVELRLAVEQRFGVTIPVLALSEGATIATMAGRILRSLGSADGEAQRDTKATLVGRLAMHDGGSDSAVAQTVAPVESEARDSGQPHERGFAIAAAASP